MAIFNTTREKIRRFFCDTWKKKIEKQILDTMQILASDYMEQHPEYHTLLANPAGADCISEQISINQPLGIKVITGKLSKT